MMTRVILFLLLATSLTRAAKYEHLTGNVYKDCHKSGNGHYFCIGSKGRQVSYADKPADGCIPQRMCTIVVQGERKLMDPRTKRAEVTWQIWIHNDTSTKMDHVVSIAFAEETLGDNSQATILSGEDLQSKLQNHLLFVLSDPNQDPKIYHVTKDGKTELNAVEKAEILKDCPECREAGKRGKISGDHKDINGTKAWWNVYRFKTGDKLQHKNINDGVGNLHGMVSVWAQREVGGRGVGDGIISGVKYKIWSEKSPGVKGDYKEEDDVVEEEEEKSNTGLIIGIIVAIVIIALILIALFYFCRRKKQPQRQASRTSKIASQAGGASRIRSTSVRSGMESAVSRPPSSASVRSGFSALSSTK